MQQTQIIAGIKNPLALQNNADALLFVLNQFPYCQTVQMLYAQNLKLNNAILFEQQLKKAATYCTDRHQLFNQLDKLSNLQSKKIETTSNLQQPTTNFQPPTSNSKKIDAFEKDYLVQAINSAILLETTDYTLVDEDKIEVEEETTLIEKENDFDSNTNHTFNDWIAHFSSTNPSSLSEIKKNREEIPKNKIKKNDLIEKFIQENPKIQPKKTAFYSPVNMARLSVIDDSEIVSETLALVHVDQGNYQKAISMYEKLSLKNPKKRSYFATQIKNLTQKLK